MWNDVSQSNIEKIKESCIKIQENNLSDQIKNLENENTKSSFIIWFIGAIIALVSNDLEKIEDWKKAILLILFIAPILISLYNIASKKVLSHISIKWYFVNRTDKTENFLNDIHMRLEENYNNVTQLLNLKSFLTKLAYSFTILLLIFILFIKLF